MMMRLSRSHAIMRPILLATAVITYSEKAYAFAPTSRIGVSPRLKYGDGVGAIRAVAHPVPIRAATSRSRLFQVSKSLVSPSEEGDDDRKNSPMDFVEGAYEKYIDWCHRKPFRTKAITASVVCGMGDLMAQYIEARVQNQFFALNVFRLRGFMLAGLLFEGPWMHVWYEKLWSLGDYLKDKYNMSSKKRTVCQILVDQTIGIILFYPLWFYVYEIVSKLSAGQLPSFALVNGKLEREIRNVFLKQYYVWPAANWIIFRYIPKSMRVLASNIVNVFWNAYLCTRVAG